MKLTSSTRGECTITGRAATLDSAAHRAGQSKRTNLSISALRVKLPMYRSADEAALGDERFDQASDYACLLNARCSHLYMTILLLRQLSLDLPPPSPHHPQMPPPLSCDKLRLTSPQLAPQARR